MSRAAIRACSFLCLAWPVLACAGDVLRIGNGNEPETLDPHKAEGVSALNIVRDLYEGLTAIAPDGKVIAGAAGRWEASADGLTWTFNLRENARWSNGDPVVAEDFVAGLRRSVDPHTASAFAQMLAPLLNAREVIEGQLPPDRLGVAAVGTHELELRLRHPAPYLLGLLAHPATFPIHRASLARQGDSFDRPGRMISNGAYVLREWALQSHVELERNSNYWNAAATRIGSVRYIPTEDINSELKRYRAGELDITAQIPLVQARWIRENLRPELHADPYIGSYWYGLNVQRAPFKDNAKLRRALTMALDREVIVGKVMNGLARPAYGWVPPGTSGYTPQVPEWAGWPPERRLAEARRLYAEAGYSADNPAEIELRYNTHDDHRRIATVASAMWKQFLGVRTRLVNEEFKVFIANRRMRQVTQVFRAVWIGDYDDATSFLDILRSTHGQNDTGWADARYDALLERASTQSDPAARAALLQEAERRIQEEWPAIPVYWYVSKHLVKPRVRGWTANLLDYHYSKDLWLAQ